MSSKCHVCKLHIPDNSGLPRLPPNASCIKKCRRSFWKLIVLNPAHFMAMKVLRNKSAIMTERKKHIKSAYYYVIHPFSTLNVVLEALFALLWFNALILDPLLFLNDRLKGITVLLVWNNVVLLMRLVLILFFFNIGYVDGETKEIVIEPQRIITKYLSTFFIFDFCATRCLAQFTQLFIFERYSVPDTTQLIVINIIYVVRIASASVRIRTLLRYLENTLAIFTMRRWVGGILVNIVKTFIFLHLLSFLIYYIPIMVHVNHKLSPESWVFQANITSDKSLTYCYFECFLTTSSYFFGVTYIYNINLMSEEICIVFISLCGRLYTLYLIADILNIFDVVGVSESKYEAHMGMLKEFIEFHSFPENFKLKLLKYYEYKFQKHCFSEEAIVNTLSDHLRAELFLFSARKMIQKVNVFRKIPNDALGAIIATMKAEVYSPNDVIVKLKSVIDEVYFISSGTVAVMNKHDFEVCHLEDGDEFGMSSFIYKRQLHAVVAVEPTEVFTIKKTDLINFLNPYPDILQEFYKAAKDKLNNMLRMENEMYEKKTTLLADLRSGYILENLCPRSVIPLE